ncbi:MAG TPA: TetR/AcrR family transcriptional regulator [Micromonosporaceae bacterium]|nr:TetR/AcrR family transcriptional regulator [Micromonosporaceae bacterium]
MFGVATDLPVPSWKRTRPTPSARPQLSRDLIVETALKLLDADGLDGVSMRRVADELGTGPASLYAHVANKEELLDLLLDRVIAEIDVPEPDPANWQDQLRQVGRDMHAVFTRHRDIAAVSLANIPTGAGALRIADRMMAIMIAGGVPPKVAGWTLDRLALYVGADAYEESLYTNRQLASGLSMEKFIEQYIGGIREFYEHLPRDQFPTLSTHVEDLVGGDGDARFEFGLDMIVRSLATYVTDPPAG